MKQKVLSILSILHFFVLTTLAQQMTVQAPQQVAVGEQFRLVYTVNSHDVSGFRIGQIPSDAFEVLMGPSTSTQSSFSMVNGKTSQSSSVSYTYILSALKNGTFTIPAASANVGGKHVSSQSVKIQVSGSSAQGSQGGSSSRQQSAEVRPSGSQISGADLFIKVTASKRRVVEQEPVLLTYKVYTLVGLSQLEGKMPDLKGFHTQEVPLPQEKSFHVEQFNGRNYKTVTWSQYVMFPQSTGTLQVPPITFNGIVVQQDRSVDPFEAFFNGGSGYVEVKKQIQAPGVEITVDPLPARPDGFSGGVGKFTVKADIDKTHVKSNDPVTLRVTVQGTGNLQLIKEPVVKFPKDFDTYDAKTTDKTRLTANGVEGSVIYEYLAVPRHQGKFEIPPVEFVYYDTQSKRYVTQTTDAFTIDVERGEGESAQSYAGQEDVQVLDNDIRHIKLGDASLGQDSGAFFGSPAYWVSLAVLLMAFITLIVVFRQRALDNADLVNARRKKANKVATKRLKTAARLMKEQKQSAFYDEVLRALWGYVGDKLNIPVEQLSRDNISSRLTERQVNDDTVGQFIGAIDECEFERYAPGDAQGNMNKVYERAITAIENIENTMKRKSRKSGTAMILLAAVLLVPSVATAATKAEADSLYQHENYQQAIQVYEELLKAGKSAEVYYNLGNAYYRMDDMTHAILAYERALLLSPGDGDIRFNLRMARDRTIDRESADAEFFMVAWGRALVNLRSADGWAYAALLTLGLTIVLVLIYLFAGRIWLRKVGFFGGVLTLLLFVLCNMLAWLQKNALEHRRGAVIIQSAVPVKSTPAENGTDLFILHEGTKVEVTDSMDVWREVRMSDGKQGWVENHQIEII